MTLAAEQGYCTMHAALGSCVVEAGRFFLAIPIDLRSMNKQQQFLAMVQTTFLANAINLSIESNPRERRAEFSATAAIGFMEEAVRAAERIPESMSATDAAHEFLSFMLDSLRADNATVPLWFAR